MSVFQVVLGLLLWTGSTGSMKTLFVQTGSDVTLDILHPEALKDYVVLIWRFRNKKVLVTAQSDGTSQVLNDQVTFHSQNCSVTLRNLQQRDSGFYSATAIKNNGPQMVSDFSLTVLDPVSPVKLTVDSVRNSSESCNFTVSCTTRDVHTRHSFTCFDQICDEKRTEERTEITPSAASPHLYLTDVSIICNHSNQVSWTRDVTDIRRVCPGTTGSEQVSAGVSVCLVKSAVFSVGLVVMISAVVSVHVLDCIKKRNL